MIGPLVERLGLFPLLILSSTLIWMSTVFYNLYIHPLRKIPGPRLWAISRIPLARSFTTGASVKDLEAFHRRYGPAVRITPNAVSFAHPDAWHDTMGNRPSSGGKPYSKSKAWWTSMSSKFNSITTAIDHDEHALIRKTIAPAFTTGALKQQEPLVQAIVAMLIQKFHEKIQNSDGTSEPFNIIPWFNYTAFDIFSDIAYGETFDCVQTTKHHPFVQLIFDTFMANAYQIAIRMFPTLNKLFQKFVYPYMLTEKQKQYGAAVIGRIDRRSNLEVSRPDIMSHIIERSEKNGMTSGQVHATFQTMTLAGSETTATTLSGLMNKLITHPEIYKKLINEVRGSFAKESDITFDAIKELPYLNACITETMRLCPAAPLVIPRVVPEGGDMVCGTWIAGGTDVFILPWAVYHDPKLWHDATSFHPERWLPEAEDEKSPFVNDRRDALHTFGEGPRKCIGMHLAWAELRLIGARLLWSFDYELADEGVAWEKQKTYILVARAPLMVRLKERVDHS